MDLLATNILTRLRKIMLSYVPYNFFYGKPIKYRNKRDKQESLSSRSERYELDTW